MNLIVISSPENIPNEVDLVNALFEEGLMKFHLRKPMAGAGELISYISKLKPAFLNKVVIHYNFDLSVEYPLAGFHFNDYSIGWFNQRKSCHKSYSAHSYEEIIGLNGFKFDYVFLSPIFNSISKLGYTSNFEIEKLYDFLTSGIVQNPIIALGGIDEENIGCIKDIGFYGAALLGAIWNPFQDGVSVKSLVDKFLRMKEL